MWQSEERCSTGFIFFIVSVVGNWKNGNPWRHIIAQTTMGGSGFIYNAQNFRKTKPLWRFLGC
jgi:hypothetical protein